MMKYKRTRQPVSETTNERFRQLGLYRMGFATANDYIKSTFPPIWSNKGQQVTILGSPYDANEFDLAYKDFDAEGEYVSYTFKGTADEVESWLILQRAVTPHLKETT